MNVPSLNFNLGETIDALRDTLQAFCAAEIAPRAAEIDPATNSPRTCGRNSATSACMA